MDEARAHLLTRFATDVVQHLNDVWQRHSDEHGCAPLDCPIGRPLFNAQYALPERLHPVLLAA